MTEDEEYLSEEELIRRSHRAAAEARQATLDRLLRRRILDTTLDAVESGLKATKPKGERKGRPPADHRSRLVAARLSMELHQMFGIVPNSKSILELEGGLDHRHRLSDDDRQAFREFGDAWAKKRIFGKGK